MKKQILAPVALICLVFSVAVAQKPSYPFLTTSNGLVVATFNTETNRVEGVWPHIFAAIDSGKFVHPFVGNIEIATAEKPARTFYKNRTHVVESTYRRFSVDYLASFSEQKPIFYVVVRGARAAVEAVSLRYERGEGREQTGVTHLTNPWEPMPDHYSGALLVDSLAHELGAGVFEKTFLFSLTDSLHTDPLVLKNEIQRLLAAKTPIVEAEVAFMRRTIDGCKLPQKLNSAERRTVEQSISLLKMSQISQQEVFERGRGQVLASLRPGLWHVGWVRDGAFAIRAMARLGMHDEARLALEAMLRADAGRFKHYNFKGKDYGPGVDYQISLTRYFGNGREECDFNEWGPNIEFDDWGLFLIAFCEFVDRSGDQVFAQKWNEIVKAKVGDALLACISANDLVRADSGPWEHHLHDVKQYAFTSSVCAKGLFLLADMERKMGDASAQRFRAGAERIRKGIEKNLLVENRYFKSNAQDSDPSSTEYHDAGALELFADGLFSDPELFRSHMQEYDRFLRTESAVPGYVRMRSDDIYENQEWVFIDLRVASALLKNGKRRQARRIIQRLTALAEANNGQLPEMLTYNNLWKEPVEKYADNEAWCRCVSHENGRYAGSIPMAGYGAGAYVLAVLEMRGQ